jgi:glutaredoxin
MDKFTVRNDSCGFCAREYIDKESSKLADMQPDQKKTNALHKMLRGASKASSKPVVIIGGDAFGNGQHKICVEHLYKMIDAIKEYEDESKDE